MNEFPVKNCAFGIVGGVLGGIVGGLICKLLAGQGFYGGALAGASTGLGFALGARTGHVGLGFVSGFLGLIMGLITEWQVFHSDQPFVASIMELKDEGIVTWIMLGLGTVLAYSIGKGNTYSRGRRKIDNDQEP